MRIVIPAVIRPVSVYVSGWHILRNECSKIATTLGCGGFTVREHNSAVR